MDLTLSSPLSYINYKRHNLLNTMNNIDCKKLQLTMPLLNLLNPLRFLYITFIIIYHCFFFFIYFVLFSINLRTLVSGYCSFLVYCVVFIEKNKTPSLMIQDEQVLVTVDVQRFYMEYMFGITYKVTIIYFIRSEQTTRKKYLLPFLKK